MHLLQKWHKISTILNIQHSGTGLQKQKSCLHLRPTVCSTVWLFYTMWWKKPMHDKKICTTIFTLPEKPSLLTADLTGGRLSLSITPVWLSFFSDLSAWLILVIHSCKQFENLPDLQTALFFWQSYLESGKESRTNWPSVFTSWSVLTKKPCVKNAWI